jgi:hypothetical protein
MSNDLTREMVEGHRLLAKIFMSLPDSAIRKVHTKHVKCFLFELSLIPERLISNWIFPVLPAISNEKCFNKVL